MRAAKTDVRGETRALVRLAVPLAATHLGEQLLGIVDTAVVGRVDPVELGAVGLGNGVYFVISVFGIGLLLGVDPLISQAVGAGEERRARRLLWQGIWLAAAVTLPIAVLSLLASGLLPGLGVAPESAARATHYVAARLVGLFPMVAFMAVRSYLQAHHVTRPLIVGVVVANVLNVPLSWLLVLGDGGLERLGLGGVGLPAMGAAGAGLTSSVCTALKLGIVAWATRRVATTHDPQRRRFRPDLARSLARLGLPIGLQLSLEVGGFAITAMLMGRLGELPLAAHQVAITLASGTFMVPLGVGAATSVRVGHAIGRGDVAGTRAAGLIGLCVGAAFMVLAAGMFLTVPGLVARVITDRPDVVAAAVPLILVAAVFQVSDGLQVVAAGALRGAGETRWPLVTNLLGHYGVGLPLGAMLAFWGGYGARGLWMGLCAGLTVVAVVLTARFVALSARPIARAR